jgi:hypothetical protein
MKFRIIELIHRVNELSHENGRATIEFVIEKKNMWGCWKEVFMKELNPTRISHKTYEDAEAYLFSKYMGHGVCKRINNGYKYTPYTYYV